MNQALLTPYDLAQVMAAAIATGLFVSLASFTAPPTAQGPTGNPVGDYTPIAGLQDISCMDAPESLGRPSVDEAKKLENIEASRLRHVLLNACYPQLRTGAELAWRCTVDGVLYDLLGAEQDSQSTQTRCKLYKVAL